MNLQEVIDFANSNQVCYVATADGDQPRVRAFMMWFADESGFYFHTGGPKNVFQQIKRNPKVEVCFFAPAPPPVGRTLRVTGSVEFVDDLQLKTRLLDERAFLKAYSTGADDPNLVVFRIAAGEACFWTMDDNMKESEIERVIF